jgi:hypothetical protein
VTPASLLRVPCWVIVLHSTPSQSLVLSIYSTVKTHSKMIKTKTTYRRSGIMPCDEPGTVSVWRRIFSDPRMYAHTASLRVPCCVARSRNHWLRTRLCGFTSHGMYATGCMPTLPRSEPGSEVNPVQFPSPGSGAMLHLDMQASANTTAYTRANTSAYTSANTTAYR